MVSVRFFTSTDRTSDDELLRILATSVPRKGDRAAVNGKYGWLSGEVIHVGWLFDNESDPPVVANVVILPDRR